MLGFDEDELARVLAEELGDEFGIVGAGGIVADEAAVVLENLSYDFQIALRGVLMKFLTERNGRIEESSTIGEGGEVGITFLLF